MAGVSNGINDATNHLRFAVAGRVAVFTAAAALVSEAAGGAGSLVIADTDNGRIRIVTGRARPLALITAAGAGRPSRRITVGYGGAVLAGIALGGGPCFGYTSHARAGRQARSGVVWGNWQPDGFWPR